MARISSSVVAAILALASSSPAMAAAPVRGWAHAGKVVDLQRNGVRLAHDDTHDRQMVAEALSRWGIAYDEGRMDVIASLFTADAQFSVLNGSATPISAAHGRDDILKTVSAVIAQQKDQRRHLISNIVVDKMTANTATLLAYAAVFVPADQITVGATVIYSVDLRRESDGVWRFSRMVIGMDAYAGTAPSNQQR